MTQLERFLLVLLLLLVPLLIYLIHKSSKGVTAADVQPLDTVYIAWVAVVFVFLVVCLFIYFGENKVAIGENVGQIGDFIGGLTNPVLSFLALIVLLRTTAIQTSEARKTTVFMSKQQEVMDKEKFENTFFQLLNQLETFCERHLRVEVNGLSVSESISKKLRAKRLEFNKLEEAEQISAAEEHVSDLTNDAICIIFHNRAMRVVRFLERSRLPRPFKRGYASILRDTIYPDECIILSSMCYDSTDSRVLLKDWGVVDLNKSFFVCDVFEDFYLGE